MVLFGSKPYRIHFVGVGGIGMSGIAELLVNLGFRVSGSDLRASEVTRRLESLGARIMLGHDAANIEGADVIVISSAVKADNPEVRFARAQKIPVIRRAEMLAELMRLKYGIAVAGSHGKTTTTSLVATVLDVAGCDPTMVVGGKLRAFGSNARLGQSEYLVAEADESDGSFLLLSPAIAIVTNIDDEHLDHFGTPQAIKAAFTEFVNRLPFYGLAALCADHPGVRAILPAIERRFVTYGITTETADYLARDIAFETTGLRFTVVRRGETIGTVSARLFGEHNVRNILAVIAVADELGIPFATTVAGLAAFQGVERRFEVKGEAAGVLVVDDYGHHPEEIRATLAGARRAHDRRIVVAFQPHRFTRTRDCFDDFITAFDDAHHVFITDIYPAGEAPIDGITTTRLVEAMHAAARNHVTHVPALADLPARVAAFTKPGDLVFTLGAGSISQIGPEILHQLNQLNPQPSRAHAANAPEGRAT